MIKSERLISLDVFRGITIAAMLLVNCPGNRKCVFTPLKHSYWDGSVSFADFIFPFFIFIVGVSITLSFSKQRKNGKSTRVILKKTLWRTVKIFAIGVALKILPNFNFERIDLPGVLQRIALVFLACAALYLYTNWKTQIYIGVGILVSYWLTMTLIPIPGFGTGILSPGQNLANWLDSIVIPRSLLNKRGFDSEGFYSTFPAIVSGITGLLAGQLLLQKKNKETSIIYLFVIGSFLIITGTLWSWFFPMIKQVWTSSFVLYTSGWAFIIFAILIWLIDVKGIKTGLKPWIIFGSNAIAIYVLADVFDTIYEKTELQVSTYSTLLNFTNLYAASLIWAVFAVSVCYLAGYIMYKKKIFIKL